MAGYHITMKTNEMFVCRTGAVQWRPQNRVAFKCFLHKRCRHWCCQEPSLQRRKHSHRCWTSVCFAQNTGLVFSSTSKTWSFLVYCHHFCPLNKAQKNFLSSYFTLVPTPRSFLIPLSIVLPLSPGLALTYILDNCFKPESGSRVGIPKIGILITDGKSQDDVIPSAESLRDAGVELFAIGRNVTAPVTSFWDSSLNVYTAII